MHIYQGEKEQRSENEGNRDTKAIWGKMKIFI